MSGDGDPLTAAYGDDDEPSAVEGLVAAARAITDVWASPLVAGPGPAFEGPMRALRDALADVDEAARR